MNKCDFNTTQKSECVWRESKFWAAASEEEEPDFICTVKPAVGRKKVHLLNYT